MRIYNLILAATTAILVLAAPSPKKGKAKRSSGFQWFGSNESGAEFGSGNIPGVLGTDYTWPNTTAIQILIDAGMNIFRIPFLMERLVPNELTGPADPTYMGDLVSTVNYVTSAGAHAVIDPHNFGRYYGNIINSTSDFGAFWTTVASQFVDNSLAIFDTNNEYYGMDESLVVDLNQAAINAIRATGATTQYIFAEGNSYTGAWTWTSVNTDMIELTDPSNKLIYEMHQYLDSDGSGTSDVCVNSTIGQSRVESATQWLISNQKVAFLGEFAAGANSLCEEAVTGMLSYMEQNSDVWLGAEWWSAGPWWADYIFSMEPPSGTAYEYYISVLEPYFPGGSGPTTTTTTTATTSTAVPTSTTSSASSTSTAVAQEWGQCGGVGWTGPTVCASPWTCQEQNAYYSQCL